MLYNQVKRDRSRLSLRGTGCRQSRFLFRCHNTTLSCIFQVFFINIIQKPLFFRHFSVIFQSPFVFRLSSHTLSGRSMLKEYYLPFPLFSAPTLERLGKSAYHFASPRSRVALRRIARLRLACPLTSVTPARDY